MACDIQCNAMCLLQYNIQYNKCNDKCPINIWLFSTNTMSVSNIINNILMCVYYNVYNVCVCQCNVCV